MKKTIQGLLLKLIKGVGYILLIIFVVSVMLWLRIQFSNIIKYIRYENETILQTIFGIIGILLSTCIYLFLIVSLFMFSITCLSPNKVKRNVGYFIRTGVVVYNFISLWGSTSNVSLSIILSIILLIQLAILGLIEKE